MNRIFKDDAGRRVEITSDSTIRFGPVGGGFLSPLPAAEFFKYFAKDDSVPTYKRALFSIDCGEWAVCGYHTNSRWNGWAMPCFTMEQAQTLARVMGVLEYDAAADTWQATYDGSDPQYEYWEGCDIEVDGKKFHVYAIGAGGWTWDVSEIK